jgi:hypothetical protein
VTGSAVSPPANTSIARVDFTGTANATTVTITHTVRFLNGSTATGTLTFRKS